MRKRSHEKRDRRTKTSVALFTRIRIFAGIAAGLLAVTGLIGVASYRAYVHLLGWRTSANLIVVAERCVVNLLHGSINEAHLCQHDGVANRNSVIHPTQKINFEGKRIRQIRVSNLCSRFDRDPFANILRFYESVNAVVCKLRTRNFIQSVHGVDIQRWTPASICEGNRELQWNGLGNVAGNVRVNRRYPSSRTGNQELLGIRGAILSRLGLISGGESELMSIVPAFPHFIDHSFSSGSVGLCSSSIDARDVSLVTAYCATDDADCGQNARKPDHSAVKLKLLFLVLVVAIFSFSGFFLKFIEASIKDGDSTFVMNYAVIVGLLVVGQFVCYLVLRKILG
jgi:hypothetical protein